jgi:penicillin-insensitive murein endopeptidase
MLSRLAAAYAASFVLVLGLVAGAERLSLAQSASEPSAVAPVENTPANAPGETSPTEANPRVLTAPEKIDQPAQSVQPAQTAEPAQQDAAAPVRLPLARPAAADKPDLRPAPVLFSSKNLPSLGKAMAIGYYPKGCLSGGVELPIDGATWQVMRLSRNRNWGHPSLVRFLEKFAPRAAKATGWNGVLVGDMAQPRGGPTPTGHMSHQTGLDVDIWFMPMPDHRLTREERERISATNVVADDWLNVNPKTWTPQHIDFIKTAAEAPEVERVLVNAAIKKELCRVDAKAPWMSKVRPWYGHHDHIHVRLKCPEGSPDCTSQPAVAGDDGCAKGALNHWFSDKVLHPQKKPGPIARKPLMMSDLPPACKQVLSAPANGTATAAKSD